MQQNTSVSLSGAGENIFFRGGFSTSNTSRIVPNSYLKRFSINTKTNAYISDKVNVEMNATYSRNENQNPLVLGNSESSLGKNWLYNWNRSMRPEVLKNFRQGPDEEQFVDLGFRGWRYYKEVYENEITEFSDRLIAGFALNYDIFKFLRFTGRVGMDMDARSREFKITKDQAGSFTGKYETGRGIQRQNTYEALLAFKKRVHPNLDFGLTAGTSEWRQSDDFLNFSTQEKGLTKEDIFHVSAVNISTLNDFDNLGIRQDVYKKTIRSAFGFMDLSFKEFINLQVTGRMDWSSTLPLDNNNYFYPSVNSSLILNKVLQLPQFWNKAILRGSWAQVRTDESPFLLDPTFSEASRLGQYAALLGDRDVIPPTDLQPSLLNEVELGFEAAFFNQKIGFELVVYQSNASQQSITAPLPLSSGFESIRLNSAEIRNRGLELSLSIVPIERSNFDWMSTINLSHNRNKVLQISDDINQVSLGRFSPGTENVWAETQAIVGEAYGVILANDFAVDDQENKIINPDGSWKLTNQIVPIGNFQPDLILGINNVIRISNWQLRFLLDGTFGQDAYWGTKDWAERLGQAPETLDNRDLENGGIQWTDAAGNEREDGVILQGMKEIFDDVGNVIGYENNDVIVPSFVAWQSQPHAVNILDGSFLKLRELSFSYSIPSKKLSNAPIKGLTISLIAKNLAYLYSALPNNYNPESVVSKTDQKQGIEFGALPGVRSFGMDMRIRF